MWKRIARTAVPAILQELVDDEAVEVTEARPSGAVDFILRLGRHKFDVCVKGSAEPASVALVTQDKHSRKKARPPLLVVPYMGSSGEKYCAEAKLSWLDLSGNANIHADGLRIVSRGRKNKYPRQRRDAIFAPKAARVARLLLGDPSRQFTQRDLVEATGLTQGYVSRITRRLEESGFAVRDKAGLRVADPSQLLTAWQEHYDFNKHQILKGHIHTRSGEQLLEDLSRELDAVGIVHAATGLAGAWLLTHFAMFRLVTMYINEQPSAELLERLGFRAKDQGANVWFVLPNDEGVFLGTQRHDGIPSAAPVQVLLDLPFNPERSEEAAARLREQWLKGTR